MSTLPRKRRSREEWQRLVKEQQASELNQTAFCERHAIGLASFGQWKHRFQRETPTAKTGKITQKKLDTPAYWAYYVQYREGRGARPNNQEKT